MSFLDKLKSTAGSAMAAVSDAAKDVSDKGKEMTEKARINKAIKAEEAKINNLYLIMGQKLFETNSSAPEGFEPQFAGINNAKAEIEKLKKTLEEMSPILTCPTCGTKVGQGQPFCQSCGTKLNTAPAQEPAQTAAPAQSSQPTVEAPAQQPSQEAEPSESAAAPEQTSDAQ